MWIRLRCARDRVRGFGDRRRRAINLHVRRERWAHRGKVIDQNRLRRLVKDPASDRVEYANVVVSAERQSESGVRRDVV